MLMEVDIAGMPSMVEDVADTCCAEAGAGCTADCDDDAFDDAFELSEEADDTCVGRFGKGASGC